jgi:hypothetical protein
MEGSVVTSLTPVGCGRDSVMIDATQGIAYRIQIAGVFGDSGHLIVTLEPAA